MAKKTRKSRTKSKSKSRSLSIEEQEKETQSLLTNGKYKDASESCKILLKHENRPEWLDLLATIYQGRAKELAGKGMFKEAVVIWQHRSEICHRPLANKFYFRLLLKAQMINLALELYQNNQLDLSKQNVLAEIREQLAAFSLTESVDFLAQLPADDLIVKDYPIAMAALRAYCDSDDELLAEQLALISFRSPFRELRILLKASLLAESNIREAEKHLARIDDDSPYKSWAKTISASLLPTNQLFSSFSSLTTEVIQYVIAGRDSTSQLLKFFNELKQLADKPRADGLLRFVIRHQTLLGDKYFRYAGLRLIHQEPKNLSIFQTKVEQLSYFERNTLDIWNMESKNAHPMQIVESWDENRELLKPNDCESSADYHLSLASIGRRIIQHLERYGNSDEHISEELVDVIHHDPQDHASYIRLIAIYRENRQFKFARSYIDNALKIFPDDIAVLSEAVATALANQAYKKATQLAAKILQKDPINSRVRSMLIEAHLSHSRKLLTQRKYTLAEKELDLASSWVKTKEDKTKIDFVRGVLLLDLKQTEQASQKWRTAIAESNGELCGHFFLLAELFQHKHKRPVKSSLKLAGFKPTLKKVSKEHLLDFFNLLKSNYHDIDKQPAINSALTMLQPSIEKAINHSYSVSEYELISEVGTRFHLETVILKFLNKARKAWKNEPILIYYELYTKMNLNSCLTNEDFRQLEDLYYSTNESGNTGLASRIDLLLNRLRGPTFFDDDDFDDDDEFDDDEDEFDHDFPNFGPNPDDMDGLVDMFLKMVPARELKEIGKELGESDPRKIILAVLKRGKNKSNHPMGLF